jgi:hypothetical protein
MHNSGASRGEMAEMYLAVIASEAKQSILSSWQHGLLRCARNDGMGRLETESDTRRPIP